MRDSCETQGSAFGEAHSARSGALVVLPDGLPLSRQMSDSTEEGAICRPRLCHTIVVIYTFEGGRGGPGTERRGEEQGQRGEIPLSNYVLQTRSCSFAGRPSQTTGVTLPFRWRAS
ncbi:hypothetical protein AAFF_G00133770 [Aldrovandia affinis]|uniref:Uncharacterized protein n=1 Tax=Aldrovandia affinis TaxID=143900 RepID=A0AAD7RQB9_9TELE|nr:hypothetical protein AAFF_G00133770 [Aldrovandia affinis]